MFVDLDWPTNTWSPLSASAELLVMTDLRQNVSKTGTICWVGGGGVPRSVLCGWEIFRYSKRKLYIFLRTARSFNLVLVKANCRNVSQPKCNVREFSAKFCPTTNWRRRRQRDYDYDDDDESTTTFVFLLISLFFLEVTIWLELCTSYSSSCHDSPPPSSLVSIRSRTETIWRRLTQIQSCFYQFYFQGKTWPVLLLTSSDWN